MKFFLHVDQFFNSATKKGFPLLRWCNHETITHRVSGTGEPGTDPYEAHLMEEGRRHQLRLGSKNQDEGTPVFRIFIGEEIVDVGGDVVLLMAA